jgi:hypothetical protein
MDKWADFLISAVRHQVDSGKRIVSHFKIHKDKGSSVGESTTWTKDEVLNEISKGKTFAIIYRELNGNWRRGSSVTITKVEEFFLRTDSQPLASDYLTELPDF